MKRLIIVSIFFLAISGICLRFPLIFLVEEYTTILSIAHLWIGMLFLVTFPLYAWDHITTHNKWLRKFSLRTISGLLQLSSGVMLILTGVILYLYGIQSWSTAKELHWDFTLLLLFALLLHYRVRR